MRRHSLQHLLCVLGLLALTAGPLAAQPTGSPFPTSPPDLGTPEPQPVGPETPPAEADDDGGPSGSESSTLKPPRTAAEIEAEIARLKDLNLGETDREQATRFLQEALQATAEFDRFREDLEKSKSEYVAEPDPRNPGGPDKQTKEWYQLQLATPIREVVRAKISDLASDPLPELMDRATRLEEYANKWATRVRELEAAPTARAQWLNNSPARSLEIKQELDNARATIARIDAEGLANPVVTAQRIWLAQREARLLAEQAAMEARKEAITRGEDLHSLELELAKRKAAFYRDELASVREGISARRQQEAAQQVQVARDEVDANRQLIDRYPDTVGAVAEQNQQLTALQQELAEKIDATIAQRAADSETEQKLRSRFAPIKAELESDERLSQASGLLLRDERNRLPPLSRLRNELARAVEAKNDAGFRRFQRTQELAALEDLEAQAARLARDVPAADRPQAQETLHMLLERQRRYLQALVRDLSNLEAELGSLVATKESLLALTSEFRDFIAERDLWIRSNEPMHYFNATHFWGALEWSLRPQNWIQAGEQLVLASKRYPNRAIGGLALFLLFLLGRPEARRRLAAVGQEAAKKTCVEFFPTLRALWLTVIVSLPWPLLLWSTGWLLDGPWVEGEFSRSLSVSLRWTAWCLLLAEMLRHCCRPEGLADAHLNWPRGPLGQALRFLRMVPYTIVPIVLWSTGLDVQTTQVLWAASLGRALYIAGLLLVAVALWRILFTPTSPTYQALHRASENWLLRLHSIWRPLLFAIPLVLSVMAWIGYYYTALQLTWKVVVTAIMVFCLMIAAGLWRRWLLVNRRKLAREQARQRRAQAIAAAEAAAAAAEGEAIPPMLPSEFVDDSVDLTAISEQSRRLLQTILFVTGVVGVVLIWQNIFPALAWLNRHPLPWVPAGTVNPTTWGHLLSSLIACLVTFVLVRNVPGLLQLLVLQHLPLDQGARYAIATLARYTLLIAGIVVAANLLGINPSSISWLVAAMGVGLGFGLQEIFANFVSGVILLFERPIRVGDIVTVGDKTGVVSRIRMRATTIVDGDRKEYVVPNKDLVTERLLNWTLSDPINRITVRVGVAYGSDTDFACQLLREAATECPHVLKEPGPDVYFDEFGASALNLTLRCFLPEMKYRGETMHRLHTLIHQKFKEARLEIAFPQLDVHLRSVPTLQWEQHLDEAAQNATRESRARDRQG